jgi:hypothetical protein
MIETPADYRSFAFLGSKIRSVRFARVPGVLLFWEAKSGLFALLGFPEFCFFRASKIRSVRFARVPGVLLFCGKQNF